MHIAPLLIRVDMLCGDGGEILKTVSFLNHWEEETKSRLIKEHYFLQSGFKFQCIKYNETFMPLMLCKHIPWLDSCGLTTFSWFF